MKRQWTKSITGHGVFQWPSPPVLGVVTLLLVTCPQPELGAQEVGEGFLQISVEAPSLEACPACEKFELEDLAGSRRSYYSDPSRMIRVIAADIESMDTMVHEGLGSYGDDAWSVRLELTQQGQERLTRFAEAAPARLLVTAGSDVLVAVVKREHAIGRKALVFTLPDGEALTAITTTMNPPASTSSSDARLDRREACKAVAGARADVLATCLEQVEREAKALERKEAHLGRKEACKAVAGARVDVLATCLEEIEREPKARERKEALLDRIEREVLSGEMSDEEAVLLVEEAEQ